VLFEGLLFVKKTDREIPLEQNSARLLEYYTRINGHSIYISSMKEQGYRGIVGSIGFEDIIDTDDYT